jgi:hypothetical protein
MTQQTILRARNGQSVAFDSTEGGVKNTVKLASPQIGIFTTEDCYVKFGGDTVTVSSGSYDIRIPSGARVDLETGGHGYVAIIRDTADGTAYINEWTHRND